MIDSADIVKRSVRIAGHATSVSLEPAFWDALCDIAARRGISLNALVSRIDSERRGNLSSAIRLFVLASCRDGELAVSAGAKSAISDAIDREAGGRVGQL